MEQQLGNSTISPLILEMAITINYKVVFMVAVILKFPSKKGWKMVRIFKHCAIVA